MTNRPLAQPVQDLPQLTQLARKYPAKFRDFLPRPFPTDPEAARAEKNVLAATAITGAEAEPLEIALRKARDRYLMPAGKGFEERKEAENLQEKLGRRIKLALPGRLENQAKPLCQPDSALLDPANIAPVLAATVAAEELELSEAEQALAVDRLQAELFGLGPLEPLLALPKITDIFVNSPSQVWVESDGKISKTGVQFQSDEQVRALASRLISAAGGRLDDACPTADIQNERGQRIHAVLPPLSPSGTLLSIRLQPPVRASLAELESRAMFGSKLGLILRYLVANKKNFLISGGTGTGKTTLLNAMLSECEAGERIITIEDSAELSLSHPQTVSLLSKPANSEGRGQISLARLIQEALRMRPSRLILGECRGAELADMLTAMNTGHSGSGGTLHANSARAVPARLCAMGALAGLSSEATSLQASTAVEFILHLEREAGSRFLAEIARLEIEEDGRLKSQPLCWFDKGRRRNLLTFSEAGEELLKEAEAQFG